MSSFNVPRALLLLVLVGVTGAQASAAPTPGAALPLSSARLAGEFQIKTRVTAVSNFSSKRGETDTGTWKFTPLCSQGVCAVRLSYGVGGILSAEKTIKMSLVPSGAVYTGNVNASLSSCQMHDVTGTLALHLKITNAAWINGVWRATHVTGSQQYASPDTTFSLWHCPAGSITSNVNGTLVPPM